MSSDIGSIDVNSCFRTVDNNNEQIFKTEGIFSSIPIFKLTKLILQFLRFTVCAVISICPLTDGQQFIYFYMTLPLEIIA